MKHPGSSRFSLVAIRDKAGRLFDGGESRPLTVPARPPVALNR